MRVWPGRKGSSKFFVEDPGGIALRQIDARHFRLESRVEYKGTTGLERFVEEGRLSQAAVDAARYVDAGRLQKTDLASVPASMQWFVGRNGIHTPAALVHDYLIGNDGPPTDEISDKWADRYFRFMLEDLGVSWVRRGLMWTAVALGTRVRQGGSDAALLAVWVVLSLLGTALFVVSFFQGWVVAAILLLLLPVPASALWGRQWGAGILAAYVAPVALPPTVLGLVSRWFLDRLP